jgi:hypothetical protein
MGQSPVRRNKYLFASHVAVEKNVDYFRKADSKTPFSVLANRLPFWYAEQLLIYQIEAARETRSKARPVGSGRRGLIPKVSTVEDEWHVTKVSL